MKQFLAGTATVVLICAAACASGKGSEELAARLLETSEMHILYAEAYAAGYRDSALRDRKPEQEIHCVVSKITPELVRPVLANAYSAEFSDDELRQAISFFESQAGRNFVRHERIVVKELSGTSTEKVPELSATEVESIDAFAATRIGKLLLTPQSPFSASVKEKLRPQLYGFFEQCGNAQER
ncbi:MAG TPA: DUF2059 domain-containing protein [Pyrinomonadaceae bacterium]|nr:DUF2059 domain-containing protein [Pyrinomonadaceae bacterium]